MRRPCMTDTWVIDGRKNPLATMAYFCWKMLKDNPATKKDFSREIRNKIGGLSSEKGWRQS